MTTGAYIASAMRALLAEQERAAVGARGTRSRSRRCGRCRAARRPRSCSPGWRAFRFIGSAERRLAKPEFISPQIERQCARAMRSAGQQAGLGPDLVEVLGDRQRVPDLRAVVRQARHADRRRQQQQLLARVGVVGRDHHLVELEPGEARQQPAAQRPRRVVLAAERQRRRGRGSACGAGLARRPSRGGLARWRPWRATLRPAGRCGVDSCTLMTQALCHVPAGVRARLARKLHASSAQPSGGDSMMYHAYQAHSRPDVAAAHAGHGCRCPLLEAPGAAGRPAAQRQARRRLQGARAGRGDAPAARLAASTASMVERRAGAGHRGGRAASRRSPRCCRFRKARRAGAAQGAGRRADVGPLRDPAARHRAHRCCRTTTSTSPTGTTCATCRWRPAASASTSTPST